MDFDFTSCEKLLGYTFNDKSLLINAFTHASYVNEHKGVKSNERLEFLGDSILGYVISEALYEKFPNDDAGLLTLKKQALVSKKPLSKAINDAKLNTFLILGEGEKSEVGKLSLSENLFEAIVAVIYLDGGIDNAKRFIFSHLDVLSVCDIPSKSADLIDYKSKLLYLVQDKKFGDLEYCEIEKSGPQHKPIFTMGVKINGKLIATASGTSHKEGEKAAAKIALSILQSEDFKP